MDVGVFKLVITGERVDDRAGLLRGGGVVEVDQRLAVGFGLEDWEVAADAIDIQRRRFACRVASTCFGPHRHSTSILPLTVLRQRASYSLCLPERASCSLSLRERAGVRGK